MIYFISGNEISGQFTIPNGVTYPANWLDIASSAERAAIGIITYTQIFPTLGVNQYYTTSYVDDPVAKTRTYIVANLPNHTPTVTADYTMLPDDEAIIVDATSGDITISLASSAVFMGRDIMIKKKDSSAHKVTINAYGSELIWNITSSNTILITSQGSSISLHSDGTALFLN